MKILIVSERYWPEVGAAPSRLANMAEGFKREGNEVDVLTSLPNYPTGKILDGYRGHVRKKEIHNGVNLFPLLDLCDGQPESDTPGAQHVFICRDDLVFCCQCQENQEI